MKRLLLALLILIASYPALAKDETALDRVLRTGTLRCGYYVFPPVTYRDPNTKALSGFGVDMMHAIGKAASLKIEWSEEVNFANWVAGIQAGRFDAACTPMWPDTALGRAVLFTAPFMYSGLSPIVRADDTRFKDELTRLDAADVRFLSQDGNALTTITMAAFPKAKVVIMPAEMSGPQMIQEIVAGKADAMLGDRNNVINYNKNNPTKLRAVDAAHPVKAQAFALAVERHQVDLKLFLDNAILEMLNDGTMDRLISKWETEPGLFIRTAKPYQTGK